MITQILRSLFAFISHSDFPRAFRLKVDPANLSYVRFIAATTCDDDLLSQLIGLDDLSGPHHRPPPVDNTVVC